MGDILSEFFDASHQFVDTNLAGAASPDNLFGIFDVFDGLMVMPPTPTTATTLEETRKTTSSSSDGLESEYQAFDEAVPKSKKQKQKHKQNLKTTSSDEPNNLDGEEQKMSHIAVERNRRKQMNEHLTVLRSLMPCFYVKRGDQASIIGGVVDYINELQQVLQSLEAKKQRKVYSEVVLSPRLVSPSLLSPRKPPLSPRLNNLPISPRTPPSPYKLAPRLLPNNYSSPSSSSSSTTITTTPNSPIANIVSNNELVAAVSKSPVADVEVRFSGPNVLLKTVSPKIHGQVFKIISTLESLALEILHVNVSTIDDTMVNSFTIKIGIECQLSAEELAHQIQQTFC